MSGIWKSVNQGRMSLPGRIAADQATGSGVPLALIARSRQRTLIKAFAVTTLIRNGYVP